MPRMAVCGNQIDIRDDDRNLRAILVTTKWLIKTSTVTIDVRGYSDDIDACVSWPEWFDLDKDLVRLQLTAHYPHFTLGTININGTECETTDIVWHTLRWWCKNKEWVNLGIEPDDILECDASWYIPVIARAQVFKKLLGGWSAMLRAIMRQLLVGLVSFSCAGVLVHLEVNTAMRVAFQLTANLQALITDGEGMAKCVQWNGHASMMPCWGHCNVCKKTISMVDEALGFMDITCSGHARLK